MENNIINFKRKIHQAISEIKQKEISSLKSQIEGWNNAFIGLEFVTPAQLANKAQAISKLKKELAIVENLTVTLPNLL